MRRRIRLMYHSWSQAQHDAPTALQLLLRELKPNSKPPPASAAIERYISNAEQKLIINLQQFPALPPKHNDIIRTTLQLIKRMTHIRIVKLDKNCGINIIDTPDYERAGLRLLNAHQDYQRLLTSPTINEIFTPLSLLLAKIAPFAEHLPDDVNLEEL